MPFKDITGKQEAAFVSSLRAGQYNLLLGAGFSMDSKNAKGPLPSGDELLGDLAKATNAKKSSLQRLYQLLTPTQVKFCGSYDPEEGQSGLDNGLILDSYQAGFERLSRCVNCFTDQGVHTMSAHRAANWRGPCRRDGRGNIYKPPARRRYRWWAQLRAVS